jgi:cyclopropane fatty-acyl-phospholipid synthase-like methyltransferase
MDYDETYAASEAHFGEAPDPSLVRSDHLLDPALPVLDIGCGQGRNAIYLARQGIEVHAFDPSRVAIEQLRAVVERDKLPLHAACAGFEEVRPKRSDYGGVLVFGLFQELEWQRIGLLRRFCRSHLGSQGLLWVTGHTTEDPDYARHAAEWEDIGLNSYRGPGGTVRTYLEPRQIIVLFEDYEVVHHWEGLGPEHRHGDGPVERHGRTEAVFRKI